MGLRKNIFVFLCLFFLFFGLNSQASFNKAKCVEDLGNPSLCLDELTYLGFLKTKCNETNPAEVNCNSIVTGGSSGVEAQKMLANIKGSSSSSSPGNLVFPDDVGLPDPAGGIKAVLSNFLNWLLAIIGIIALISFAISGLQYFIASGDEKSVETAKKNMKFSIIGVIVALGGFVVIRAIDAALNVGKFF